MSEYVWPDEAAFGGAVVGAAWDGTVRALPVGAAVAGRVVGRQPFGVFLALDGHPEALGLARISAKPVCLPLPALGEPVTGEVVWHDERHHQVGIRLTAWARHEDLYPAFAGRVGEVVTGEVQKPTPIGTFLGLAHCVSGLIPAAALAEAELRLGQRVRVRIESAEPEHRRLSLSAPLGPGPG
jgi:ribosomal protein S1